MNSDTQHTSASDTGKVPVVETVIHERERAPQSRVAAGHPHHPAPGANAARTALVLWLVVPVIIGLVLASLLWLMPVLQTGVQDDRGAVPGQQQRGQ